MWHTGYFTHALQYAAGCGIMHGPDGEGWGPLRADYLDRLLGTLAGRDDVAVLPATHVLALSAEGDAPMLAGE